MRLLAGQTSLNFPPGTSWSYSNTGFVAQGRPSVVTRRSLAEFAATGCSGRSAMRATRFRDDLAVPLPGLASGYTPAPAAAGPGRPRRGHGRRRRARSLGQRSGPVARLHADRRNARRRHPRRAARGRRSRRTGGGCPTRSAWRSPRSAAAASTCIWGHIGRFRSALAYLIDDGVGVAVLANRDDTFPAEIAVRIAGQMAGFVVRPPAPQRPGSASAPRWPPAGRHRPVVLPRTGQLTWRSAPPATARVNPRRGRSASRYVGDRPTAAGAASA